MNRLWLACLILVVLITGMPAQSQSEGFFPYRYENVTLDNGLKVILIPMSGSGLVAYYTIVRTGSRDEVEDGKTGFAHFFEHMMFRGTEKFPADVYNKIINEMGADANAYTTDDYTCYTSVISTPSLERMMELESDRFMNLSYEEPEFRTEAGAVYGEYKKNLTNPWRVAYEEISGLAFSQHTYKHTTMGFVEDIRRMPELYQYSKDFFQQHYRPENCVLLLAGDFDPETVKPMVETYYGPWETGHSENVVPTEPEQRREKVKKVTYNGRTLPLMWIGYKGAAFDPTDKDVVAASLLGDLAFGQNSDIYKKLVIRENKAQFVSGDFGFNRDPKLYDIYTMVYNEDDMDMVLAEIDQVVTQFQNEPVDAERLDNLKKRNRYGYLMALDTPGSVAGNLARIVALTGGVEAVDQYYETMDSLTPADIQAAAKRFLQKNRRTIIKLTGSGGQS